MTLFVLQIHQKCKKIEKINKDWGGENSRKTEGSRKTPKLRLNFQEALLSSQLVLRKKNSDKQHYSKNQGGASITYKLATRGHFTT